MSQNPITDDPRLTAYALGELNAADRAAVEQQLGDSVETLLEIEAIREVAGQLRAALQSEPTLPLTDLVAPARIAPPRVGTVGVAAAPDAFSPRHRWSSRIAVAASCVALLGTFSWVAWSGRTSGHRTAEQQLALNRPTATVLLSDSLFDSAMEGEGVVFEHLATRDLASRQTADDTTSLYAINGTEAMPQVDRYYYEGFRSKFEPRFKGRLSELKMLRQTSALPYHDNVEFDYRKSDDFGTQAGKDTTRSLGLAVESKQVELQQLHKEMAELKELSDLELPKLRLSRTESAAPVDGEVLATKESKTSGSSLIEVSLGSKDGLSLGDSLNVVRSGDGNNPRVYLGEARIVLVEADRAVGRMVVQRKLAEIQKGDRVVFGQNETTTAEAYAAIHDNPFATPLQEPLSTFSIDVDTAAYSNMRRFLTQGTWPPADAVRIEELVNYFSYDYTPPEDEVGIRKAEVGTEAQAFRLPNSPFRVHLEVAGCPWNAEHRLVRVGLKGKEIALDKRPVSNIVFLIDVSGSMNEPNKLPLVKAGLRRLVEQFTENDRVGIVVYAGASGLVLDSTNASQKDVILSSIENLQAGGSTNGGEGIQLAYALARKHFIEKGTNRVILCTDGDFNVGITNQDDLTRLIEEESKSGVFLSVLGFGMGNLKDSTLEKLADKGNGNYAYIDTLREANKVFVEQMTGTLITIAKDVKIQIEFNPALVGAYRLIGYENRMLAAQDFHDDTKDAGEIGAGHTVTALYEIIPPSKLPVPAKEPTGEKLKYQPELNSPAHLKGHGTESNEKTAALREEIARTRSQIEELKAQNAKLKSPSNELLTIKLRYKQPDADKSSLIEMPLTDAGKSFAQASTDFRFAASVASFGMILRHSPHRGNATLDAVAEIAQSSLGADKSGYRSEFVGLVRSAKALQK